MEYQHILFEKRDRIATITLNRPEKLNAISGTMFRELKLALADVEEDDNVRVVVLTGAGRAFCSSLDLKEDRQQRMGLGNALEFMYTGDWMEAEEAYRAGVLNHLVPAAEMEKETMKLARRIADGPTTAQRLVKTLTYAGLNMNLDEALELAATGEAMTISTSDHKEAVAAFKEKRKPVFTGG